MNIVRKYKISKLTGIPMSPIEEEIFSFCRGWFTNLVAYTHSNYANMTFLMTDGGTWVLTYFQMEGAGLSSRYPRIYVRYDMLYLFLVEKYHLQPYHINQIIIHFVQPLFAEKIKRIDTFYDDEFLKIEKDNELSKKV